MINCSSLVPGVSVIVYESWIRVRCLGAREILPAVRQGRDGELVPGVLALRASRHIIDGPRRSCESCLLMGGIEQRRIMPATAVMILCQGVVNGPLKGVSGPQAA